MEASKGQLQKVAELRALCELSILVVGYNSASYLPVCLNSISGAISRYSFEILFINNGDDNSEELVRTDFPEVRVLQSLGNVGFAAGNNYLAEHAMGRWLLLLNPDTKLYPGALDALLAAVGRNPEYHVVGGVTMGDDGQAEMRARLELPSLTSLVRSLLLGAPKPTEFAGGSNILKVDALNGGFMMVRRDYWDQLGGLDRSFFLYAEELDFFKRLKNIGGKAGLVADSLLYHDLGSGDVLSPNRVRYLTIGTAHYFHKHFAPSYAFACIFVLWITAVKRYFGGRLAGVRSHHYARMARGFAFVAKTPWKWMWGYDSPGADPRKRVLNSQ